MKIDKWLFLKTHDSENNYYITRMKYNNLIYFYRYVGTLVHCLCTEGFDGPRCDRPIPNSTAIGKCIQPFQFGTTVSLL